MWELLGGPGILNAAVRCEGFKIIALAFEKLSLPRRKIKREREVQIAQRGCKLPQSEKVLAGC